MACVRISFAFKVHCCYFSVAKSCPTLLWLHGLHPVRLLCPWDFPGKNTGVSCHFLLQGNLPDPGIKPVSPALTSGFFTSVPPGKPKVHWLFNCLYILKATLHLQSLQSTGYIPCVVQSSLQPILHPMLCTSHSPTLILPLSPPRLLASNHYFVLCIWSLLLFCYIH